MSSSNARGFLRRDAVGERQLLHELACPACRRYGRTASRTQLFLRSGQGRCSIVSVDLVQGSQHDADGSGLWPGARSQSRSRRGPGRVSVNRGLSGREGLGITPAVLGAGLASARPPILFMRSLPPTADVPIHWTCQGHCHSSRTTVGPPRPCPRVL